MRRRPVRKGLQPQFDLNLPTDTQNEVQVQNKNTDELTTFIIDGDNALDSPMITTGTQPSSREWGGASSAVGVGAGGSATARLPSRPGPFGGVDGSSQGRPAPSSSFSLSSVPPSAMFSPLPGFPTPPASSTHGRGKTRGTVGQGIQESVKPTRGSAACVDVISISPGVIGMGAAPSSSSFSTNLSHSCTPGVIANSIGNTSVTASAHPSGPTTGIPLSCGSSTSTSVPLANTTTMNTSTSAGSTGGGAPSAPQFFHVNNTNLFVLLDGVSMFYDGKSTYTGTIDSELLQKLGERERLRKLRQHGATTGSSTSHLGHASSYRSAEALVGSVNRGGAMGRDNNVHDVKDHYAAALTAIPCHSTQKVHTEASSSSRRLSRSVKGIASTVEKDLEELDPNEFYDKYMRMMDADAIDALHARDHLLDSSRLEQSSDSQSYFSKEGSPLSPRGEGIADGGRKGSSLWIPVPTSMSCAADSAKEAGSDKRSLLSLPSPCPTPCRQNTAPPSLSDAVRAAALPKKPAAYLQLFADAERPKTSRASCMSTASIGGVPQLAASPSLTPQGPSPCTCSVKKTEQEEVHAAPLRPLTGPTTSSVNTRATGRLFPSVSGTVVCPPSLPASSSSHIGYISSPFDITATATNITTTSTGPSSPTSSYFPSPTVSQRPIPSSSSHLHPESSNGENALSSNGETCSESLHSTPSSHSPSWHGNSSSRKKRDARGGQKNIAIEAIGKKNDSVELDEVTFCSVIGVGTQGTVSMVELNKKFYAMKLIDVDAVMATLNPSERHVRKRGMVRELEMIRQQQNSAGGPKNLIRMFNAVCSPDEQGRRKLYLLMELMWADVWRIGEMVARLSFQDTYKITQSTFREYMSGDNRTQEELKRLQSDLKGSCKHVSGRMNFAEPEPWELKVEGRKTPFPEIVLSLLAADILHGLKELHEDYHLVHCDLKPMNILLTYDREHFKIADFGCSRPLDPVTGRAKVGRSIDVGTKLYKSPERFQNTLRVLEPKKNVIGDEVGKVSSSDSRNEKGRGNGEEEAKACASPPADFGVKADVWSLGILLLELSAGIHPCTTFKTEYWSYGDHLRLSRMVKPLKWSTGLFDFILRCTFVDESERWSVSQLMKHPFVARYRLVPRRRLATFMDRLEEDSGTIHRRKQREWLEQQILLSALGDRTNYKRRSYNAWREFTNFLPREGPPLADRTVYPDLR